MHVQINFSSRGSIRNFLFVVLLALSSIIHAAGAVPAIDEVKSEIRAFQSFFQARFPDLLLEDYNDGVNALPQFSQRKLEWQMLLEFPPYEDNLQQGESDWSAILPAGNTLRECFIGKPPPIAYPYFFSGKVHTIVGDINDCLEASGSEAIAADGGRMARLVAAYKAPFSGERTDIDFRDQEIRRLYAEGRQQFWARRGQQNLSCANCHVHNAGNQLRGEVLSAALGQTTGYPAYSIGRGLTGEPMTTLHKRYQICNTLVGAAPLPAQSQPYLALEIYQTIMSSGVPLKLPSLRQ